MKKLLWLIALKLFCFAPNTYAEWVDLSTISETTTGHLCDIVLSPGGFQDLYCAGPNPWLAGDGSISATGLTSPNVNGQNIFATQVDAATEISVAGLYVNGTDITSGGGSGALVVSNTSDCEAGDNPVWLGSVFGCPDDTPTFSGFISATGVSASTVISSNIVQVLDVNYPVQVNIIGDGTPEYRTCDDASCNTEVATWNSELGVIENNDYLQLRLTSSALSEGTNSATVFIGDYNEVWAVTTELIIDTEPPTWITPAGAELGPVDEGDPYFGLVQAADFSPPITFTKVSGPSALTVNADGTLEGTFGSGDVGTNSVTINAEDAEGNNSNRTFDLTVDTSGKVLCTYYYKRGMLPEHVYQGDVVYSERIDTTESHKAYHAWAKPMIEYIDANRGGWVDHIAFFLVERWANEMASRTEYGGESNVVGWLLRTVGEPLHHLIGSFMPTPEKVETTDAGVPAIKQLDPDFEVRPQ